MSAETSGWRTSYIPQDAINAGDTRRNARDPDGFIGHHKTGEEYLIEEFGSYLRY
jgi:hypothetical protein